jgi:Chaperone of endosialidase
MASNLKRSLMWSSVAMVAFAATMTVKAPEAVAVVYCKAGVYRAGCVAARPVVRPYGVARRTARRTTRRVYRRSDIKLKQDIVLLGRLDNGLGFYRFHFKGDDQLFVGVMAQEVQRVLPNAVVRGRDGYLQVDYGLVGVKFQAYDQWVGLGAHVPAGAAVEQ